VLEDEEPHDVDGEAERAHDEHELRVVDALGPREAQRGLHADGEAERREEDGVAERAHRLGAAVAVGGARPAAAAPRDAARGEPHAQRDEVREHVEGVGHERDGVAQVARHQLGHEEHQGHKAFCSHGGGTGLKILIPEMTAKRHINKFILK
uniref:Uncharacterized protein n=1 Tax=Nothoprocta perdicaria TaxID=30464 RepID=A0A8C7EFL9_NOTPE